MTATATLSWFARHDLILAWRDWAAMMAGGKTVRERAVLIAALIFVGLLHWLAYAILKPILATENLASKASLVTVTATVLLTFFMMLSQAIEQVTRAFYARSDLDLILSSPVSSRHLFAVRIASVAMTGTAMTSLMAAPFINTAAYLDGPHWLSAYVVIAGLSAVATGLSVVASVGLFNAVGPKRTRLIAQIIAAVVGASLLIGLQILAIVLNGDLSRFAVLRSDKIVNLAPDVGSLWWLPAHAVLGDLPSYLSISVVSAAFLAGVIAKFSGQFSGHAIAATSVAESAPSQAGRVRHFRTRSTSQALRAKEWILLRRDPWLLSQSLMQILYLLPPALLLWRDMGPQTRVHIILAPVLVMAFGQLAGGLAWLAISGEDAPDLIATAPLRPQALVRAKIEAVLAVIAAASAPLLLALAFASAAGAFATAAGIAAASASSIAIQMWFKSTAKRTQFRRRQMASKAATFTEAFSSIFWAGAAGFAAAQSWVAGLFVFFALAALWLAWLISPPP